jgi:hypothetical protein
MKAHLFSEIFPFHHPRFDDNTLCSAQYRGVTSLRIKPIGLLGLEQNGTVSLKLSLAVTQSGMDHQVKLFTWYPGQIASNFSILIQHCYIQEKQSLMKSTEF